MARKIRKRELAGEILTVTIMLKYDFYDFLAYKRNAEIHIYNFLL